eukprot:2476227-Pleurochrysis_carterae.AAC.1
MRMIPTKDTNQHLQIKCNHRHAGIEYRKYAGDDKQYERGLWNCTRPWYNVWLTGKAGDITQG